MSTQQSKVSALKQFQTRLETADDEKFTVVRRKYQNNNRQHYTPFPAKAEPAVLDDSANQLSKRSLGLNSFKKLQDDKKSEYDERKKQSEGEYNLSNRSTILSNYKKLNEEKRFENKSNDFTTKHPSTSTRNFDVLYKMKREQDQQYEDRVEARSHMKYSNQQDTGRNQYEKFVPKIVQKLANIEDEQSYPSLLSSSEKSSTWAKSLVISELKDLKVSSDIKQPKKDVVQEKVLEISIISDVSAVYEDLLEKTQLTVINKEEDEDGFTVIKSLKQKKNYY